ncbi:4249_t:CDS:1 [Dentiscutata erythropus]|uniref:4249_t:CDS:1 n=1 Tax=Dentiscutata erythropus TaxID=1348616 RepID=A0A9N9IT91_9GLOM|nr:4249_t:CDS:1 [Dentiscutata erythropus]
MNEDQTEKTNPPTYFGIKTALCIKKVNLCKLEKNHQYTNLIINQPQELGEALRNVVWRLRSEVRAQKKTLKIPNTLQEFHNAFPKLIKQLFNSFIICILQKKWEIVQKKRIQHGLIPTEFNFTRAIKISTFIMSLIFSMAFPGINIWLTHVMSSLCRKPKQLNSLYAILCMANVVSHTNRYERKLEKQ